MKKVWLILIATIALLTLAAVGCKKENSANTSTTSTETQTQTYSAPASTTETTGTTGSTATSTSATTSSFAATPLSDPDHKFADKAAEGNASEVAIGKFASTRATDPDVKNFADKLVTDHTNAENELEQLAKAKNVTLPTEMDKEHRDFQAKLDKLNGTSFDKEFVADMVKDHDKDLKDFEKAGKEVKDADLKSWIEKTIPTLKEHDKIAHDLEKKVGKGK